MSANRRALVGVLCCTLLLAGCFEAGYYAQAVRGQWRLLDARRPLAEVLADPATPAPLQERLRLVVQLRAFASQDLALPENGTFRTFAALDRPAAVWNVVATPEFSLTPRVWCFPFAGCVPYRGYFDRQDAEAFAATLRASGDDVAVYPVPAYSTLGWFDDPVLSSFVDWPEDALAALIFHELAHQQLYVKGDAPFAEAFATTVEEEGVRRWLAQRPPALGDEHAQRRMRRQEFDALLRQTRGELAALYATTETEAAKRATKAAVLAALRVRYAALKEAWGGYGGYDRWFAEEVNNARFAAADTYSALLPACRELLRRSGGELPAFYAAAAQLAAATPEERQAQLASLGDAARSE